jgi:hypothetical protein
LNGLAPICISTKKTMLLNEFMYRCDIGAASLIQRLRSKRSKQPDADLNLVLDMPTIIAIGLDARCTHSRMNFISFNIPDQVGRSAPCHDIDDALCESFRSMSTAKSKLISYTATNHRFRDRRAIDRRQHQWYIQVDYKVHQSLRQTPPDP